MKVQKWLFILSLLVLLGGCQPRMLDVGVRGAIDGVLFTISLPRGLFEFSSTPADLRQVEVRDWTLLAEHPGTAQPQPQMWLIESASCDPSRAGVHYGEAPAGFAASAPAQQLREGGTYMVGVEGCHSLHNMGIATFKIVNGRAVEIAWR